MPSWRECPTCRRTGTVDEHTRCPSCAGAGKVPLGHESSNLRFALRGFGSSDLCHLGLPGAATPLCGRKGSEFLRPDRPVVFRGYTGGWCHPCYRSAYRLDRQYGREDRDG